MKAGSEWGDYCLLVKVKLHAHIYQMLLSLLFECYKKLSISFQTPRLRLMHLQSKVLVKVIFKQSPFFGARGACVIKLMVIVDTN